MKQLEALALALLVVFAPIQAAVITTFTLIILDLVTGILAARKRGEPISSSGLKRTVGKVLLYELAIVAAFLVQQYLTGDLFPASKLVTAMIGLVELSSMLENLDTLNGNPIFKTLIAKITQSKSDMEKKS